MIALMFCLLASRVIERPDDFTLTEIVGRCMEPVIAHRSVVIVDISVKFSEVKVGDVIKFWHRGKKYVHRVIQIRRAGNGERFLICKGDNVRDRETVTARDYLGRVCV